ncbi:MAG: anti-sigma regulatory factor [Anaerophaga sp.]|uniref:ATP-binding protein n=1 Tax=Anaerophaga thermohalophila TaxID=177400 RepID=UPI000237CC0F|nr:anti-sigma regulatory factor [Anaerophaga thermohalophila]MBZ4676483.1 anti-sigma regulatory factor [Anaerophaga sp.]MDK2841123.1 serine/threonine-protein kinase RsbT [Anaerophaga sp.]MDN5289791.1 serine/threonine-protein kinase RsbT [Anaerophaga sp.]
MKFKYEVEGGNFAKAGNASSEVKKIMKQLNVPPPIIKRLVVALYEGEVNVVAHAWNGSIYLEIEPDRINVKIKDNGPGIPDIEQAMQEGFSTASQAVREMGFGAGMGLPNMKKNADQLDITSEIGIGTIVELVIFLNGEK